MVADLWNLIWNQGVFVAQRGQNPTLYPFFLAGVALSLLLGVVNFTVITLRRPINHYPIGRILRTELRVLVRRELLPLYALWLAFATPTTALPVPAPQEGSVWLFLPAPAAYEVVAVLAHGALSLYGVRVIVGWLIQFNTPNQSRIDVLCVLLGYLALAVGWEWEQWPETYLVLAEFFILATNVPQMISSLLWGPRTVAKRTDLADRVFGTTYPLSIAIMLLIVLWHESMVLQLWFAASIIAGFLLSLRFGPEFSRGSLSGRRSFELLVMSFILTLAVWVVGLILLNTRDLDPFTVNIVAVFFVFTQLDTCYSLLFGWKRFGRAFLLPMITLALTLAAASGLLDGVTHNRGFDYVVWLEGGVAAAIFLLFYPLTELAREAIRIESWNGMPDQPYLQIPQTRETPRLTEMRYLANGQVSDQAHEQMKAQEAMPIRPEVIALQKQYEMLQFQGAIFFVAMAVVYHVIASSPDVFSALNGNLIGLVFAGIAAFAGFIALVAERDDFTARTVLLLLLILTATLIGADILLNVALSGTPGSTQTPTGAFNLFSNNQYLLVTVRDVIQEALVLMAAGQVFYLVVVIVAALAKIARRIKQVEVASRV